MGLTRPVLSPAQDSWYEKDEYPKPKTFVAALQHVNTEIRAVGSFESQPKQITLLDMSDSETNLTNFAHKDSDVSKDPEVGTYQRLILKPRSVPILT